MTSKHVFITGAAGFIGFHLAKNLHEQGHNVVGYDNFNDYYPVWIKEARAEILRNLGVEVIRGDLCDKTQLQAAFDKYPITHIVNLAAQAGVRYSLKHPDSYINSNIQGFLNILELCRTHPHIPLVYASSSSVYGLNKKTPFSVEDPCDHQASLYGATKKTNELMAHSYHHLFGVKATGLRFFTVYGPWGRPDMACYLFTENIVADNPIDVYNHGQMERDFTYIDDIVQGTIAAIDLEADFELFNLGNNHPEPLGRFIEILEKNLGKKAKKNLLPMQPGDVVATCADIEHSRDKLDFVPKTSLEEGLSHFVRWYTDTVATQSAGNG